MLNCSIKLDSSTLTFAILENSDNKNEAIKLGLVNNPENLPQVVEDIQEKAVD